MQVKLVYLLVIFIWSTTPLAIYFSSLDYGYLLSVALRMLLGLVIVLFLFLVIKRRFMPQRRDWRVGAFASIGIFPAMPLVYWSTQYIPTGLVSLMFSSSPFFVGVLAKIILHEAIGPRRMMGIVVAFAGLIIIFVDQARGDLQSIWGIVAMVASTFTFSLSAVLLKTVNAQSDPLQQTGGSMLLALPSLFLCWWIMDGTLPDSVQVVPSVALLYLAAVGSVVGFSAYFYLLKELTANSVSLISMLSPVLAIVWGVLFKGEAINFAFLLGAGVLLVGLGVYSGVLAQFFRPRPVRQ